MLCDSRASCTSLYIIFVHFSLQDVQILRASIGTDIYRGRRVSMLMKVMAKANQVINRNKLIFFYLSKI